MRKIWIFYVSSAKRSVSVHLCIKNTLVCFYAIKNQPNLSVLIREQYAWAYKAKSGKVEAIDTVGFRDTLYKIVLLLDAITKWIYDKKIRKKL